MSKQLLLFILLIFSTPLLQAYPAFSRLVCAQVPNNDPFEFHVPSPLDYIFDQPPQIIPPNLDKFPNLEKRAQDFVLESKQLLIDGFPGAFNPTIIRWRGAILMTFRVRDFQTGINDKIGMVWLDENLDVKGSPYILDVPPYKSLIPSKQQDPRLLLIGEHMYMVYSNVITGEISPEVRRVFFTKVHFDGIRFYTDPPEGIFSFEGEKEQKWEKNWTPFDYNGELLLAQSLSPHRIMKPICGTQSSEVFALSDQKINWKWGHLRGGTQALIVDNEYLSFFHSSTSMKTFNSLGKEMPHYVFGAYTFSTTPPFHINRISPEPIIGKGFYSGPPYKTWKPLRVVFPGGFILDDDYIWIAFGKQDHEIWITKLDRKKMFESLIPVEELATRNGK